MILILRVHIWGNQIFPILLPSSPPSQSWTVDTREEGILLLWYAKFWTCNPNVASEIMTHQSSESFYQFIFVYFFVMYSELSPQILVLMQKWQPVWSSAAVPHMIQGSMCCVFRDALFYMSVVLQLLFELLLPLYHLEPFWSFSPDISSKSGFCLKNCR